MVARIATGEIEEEAAEQKMGTVYIYRSARRLTPADEDRQIYTVPIFYSERQRPVWVIWVSPSS